MMSVTSSSAASPELCEPWADDWASRLSDCREGDAVSPQDLAFPFWLENMKVELATVYVSGCLRTETQGVVTTNAKVILRLWRVPGSTVLICSS